MRIIEERNENEKQVICETCGSKLAYYDNDYVGTTVSPYETIEEKYNPFNGCWEILARRKVFHILFCPICGHAIKCDECYEEQRYSK